MVVPAGDMVKIAVGCGFNGVVAPGTQPRRVKVICDIMGELTIISLCVGIQGGSAGDTIRAIYQSDDLPDTNASMWHYKSGCQPPS